MIAERSLAPTASGRIGPNAIIRTIEAMTERIGPLGAGELLRAAGLERYRTSEPGEMVPEAEVTALYRAMRTVLGERETRLTAYLAGRKTAEYLLANRIPRPVQAVLTRLPAVLAATPLLAAILQHTWTFAGSGSVKLDVGRELRIRIESCPICREATATAPACGFYAGTFETLFRRLVAPYAYVDEVACAALGQSACTFALRW
jgi:divinyl protochlorophyllide a 8-vinyl-reductase